MLSIHSPFLLKKHPFLSTTLVSTPHFCEKMLLPLPPQRQSMSTPLNQIVISKHTTNHHNPRNTVTEARYSANPKSSKLPRVLRQPRKTNPIIWCGAIGCLIFSLSLIFFGIVTLIIFLAIRPRNPLFEVSSASLNAIYFDSPEYFNGDFTFLANFTNPNQKIDVQFECIDIELYFSDRLIAARGFQPFTQRPQETRLEPVHMISSLVYLPQKLAVVLQKQVQSNKIQYNIRGNFRVRVNLHPIHFSYRLHARCQLEMTGPPTGVLVARHCRTKR